MTLMKEVRKEIGRVLSVDTELRDDLLVHVYDSRQMPGTYNNELCVFSGGNSPNRAAIGGSGGGFVYQYIIQWLIKFDQVDKLAETEDIADDVEDAIYRVLFVENLHNAIWRKIVFPGISLRPLAPGGTQNAHFGRILIRISV